MRPVTSDPRSYSTDTVHPRDRFAYWSDAVCASFVRLDCDRAGADRSETFFGSIETGSIDQLHLSRVAAAAQLVTRSPAQIARSPDSDLLVSVQVEGTGGVEQDGRVATLQPGDFALYDSTRPYRLRFPAPFRQVVLQMPRARLVERVFMTESLTALRIPGDTGLGTIISPLLGRLPGALRDMDAAMAARLSNSVLDLLALGLLAQRPSGNASQTVSMILSRAKSFIAERHATPELSPADVATAIGVSVRYLNRLFATEETSVTGYLREFRLRRCKRDLSDPAFSGIPIGNIAYAAGFNDLAHFSRLFRSRFGVSPRQEKLLASPGGSKSRDRQFASRNA